MTTAAYVQFDCFVQDLGDGVHDLNTDELAVYLSNAAPDIATARVKADVPEIATGHGYAGPISIGNAYSQTAGVGALTSDASSTITAAGGSVGPFRFVILCNVSKAGSPLIAYWDYDAEITLLDTQALRIGFGATVLVIQLAA